MSIVLPGGFAENALSLVFSAGDIRFGGVTVLRPFL